MIKKLKIQLSNSLFLFASLLLFVLLGFFIFAIYYEPLFFISIIETLILSLGILIYYRFLFIRKQAEFDLRKQDFVEKTNLLRAEINDESQSIESYRDRIVNYSCLKKITEKFSMSFSLDETTNTLSSEVDQIWGEEDVTVLLYLFHSKTGELGVPITHRDPKRAIVKMKYGDIYDQWVIKTMTSLLVEDARSDFRFDVKKIKTESSRAIRSLMIAPLVVGTKVIGIIRLDSLEENYFTIEDIRLLSTIADVGAIAIENSQLYARIEELAIRDSLTGLFLRRHLLDTVAPQIKEQIEMLPYSVLMIDLDKFKQYNDKFGHTAGDFVLKSVSGILTKVFSDTNSFIFRYGGEEFAVLLPDMEKKEALSLAEVLRKRIEEESILLRRKKTHITASIGVAASPCDGNDIDALFKKADEAMYMAKKKGRNKVCKA